MNNREIEVKYAVDGDTLSNIGWGFEELASRIKSLSFLKISKSLDHCYTRDYYFFAADELTVRLRDSWGMGGDGFSRQLKEITIKKKDKGNNFNRIEENVSIDDCATAHRALSLVFGLPYLTLSKKEEVYWTPDGLVISLAQVNDSSTIYLEIEGPSEEVVLNMCQQFEQIFDMKKETRSLLEIFSSVV